MSAFLTFLTIVQIITSLVMVGLILLQHGKGADMGAAFGSGGAGSLFGVTGGATFFSRATAVLAAVFFVATLTLAYFGNKRGIESGGSVFEKSVQTAPSLPATPVAPTVPADAAAAIPKDAPAKTSKDAAATPKAESSSGALASSSGASSKKPLDQIPLK